MTYPKNTPNAVCERCGKAVYAPPSRLRTFRYCSDECRYPQHLRSCKVCGVTFNIRPSQALRSGGGQFCSPSCVGEARRRGMIAHGGRKPGLPQETRFWHKVDKSEGPGHCWSWTAARDKDGYGVFTFDGRMQGAHRIAWQLVNGPIPEGMQVLHECDRPSCVNPVHLFLGSNIDNIADKVGKQRQSRRLNASQVLEIRARYRPYKVTCAMLAREYGVAVNTISGIIRRETWRHI